jgi:hypothetical protein
MLTFPWSRQAAGRILHSGHTIRHELGWPLCSPMVNVDTGLLEYTVNRIRCNGMPCEIHEADFFKSIHNVISYATLL